MMCHRIGCPPISTSGLGFVMLSSLMRVPWPPARITTFMPTPPSVESWPASQSTHDGAQQKVHQPRRDGGRQAAAGGFAELTPGGGPLAGPPQQAGASRRAYPGRRAGRAADDLRLVGREIGAG